MAEPLGWASRALGNRAALDAGVLVAISPSSILDGALAVLQACGPGPP